MSIDRYKLVSGHNPVLNKIDYSSPLTIGNGEFAFTADVTGLQSLYEDYKSILPLCTMSQWGWHTEPVNAEKYAYTMDDLVMTEYDYAGRLVKYPVKKMIGNEEVYEWLRKNPHRLNLGRIGLLYKGEKLKQEDLTHIHQELILYEGILVSDFKIQGVACHVETACDYERETLAVIIESQAFVTGDLMVFLDFPYGSADISASDWERGDLHVTRVQKQNEHELSLKRTLDKDNYYVNFSSGESMKFNIKKHNIQIGIKAKRFEFTVSFSLNKIETYNNTVHVFENSKKYWKKYWEAGGIIQFNKSKDPRAFELERRIILSQYLLRINSCGSSPPQETGLTCNSWYGKMHLEMYLWHCAWAPLWNHSELLEHSLHWYTDHIKEAGKNAAKNGYKGCRWPKMIATEGIDCPSPIAPLLIWQQPHIIFILELIYRNNKSKEFLEKYWVLIKKTAEFMTDIVVYNNETGKYDIVPPVIPVQECHRPEITKNPAFELEYWHYALGVAVKWAERLNKDYDPAWKSVRDNLAGLPIRGELYLAHGNCPDTYENYNLDHPSMLAAYGLLPSERVDKKVMGNTLKKVIGCWQYPTLWGWDFAVMAMTATRLKDPETAVNILLLETPKNDYVVSGNNRQKLRKDLPLYLPGNGALLLAIPLMVAGYTGCTEETPGFPKNGMWDIEYENIESFF
ncbi:MAG: hypothetical protein WCD89_25575 [Anaerocolumna sp.]